MLLEFFLTEIDFPHKVLTLGQDVVFEGQGDGLQVILGIRVQCIE